MEIREMQLRHFREKPEVFLDAAKRITEAQCMMVEETLKAGADGIYYAALGGERSLYTDEEFAQAIAPFDKEIMDVCRKQGKTVLLHMCKTDLDLHRFSSYAPYVDIVNWGVWCNGISLQEGREVFPGKVIMGGLENRSGVIASGSETDLTAEVRSICSSMVGTPFILGADCTLATDVSYERVRTAVEAARNFKGERA
jgi:uroporphyrinogen decarboxylase